MMAEEEMIKVGERECIRWAYYHEGKSIRQIARELHHSRETVKRAIESAAPAVYRLSRPRAAPVLGPYKARIEQLLAENENLPRKQRRTARQIYAVIVAEGYRGSESRVRSYIAAQRRAQKKRAVYIPLAFDPGADAQVDWGEAEVRIGGERVTVQLFVMRLCYSRRLFVMAFPAQKQEAFFEGHVRAFHFFGGVPRRITYDNLKTAVQQILTGGTRKEQERFILFRSHYLFESHFCTPAQGHEKGGVEGDVGFARRNFLAGRPSFDSFAALNEYLLAACMANDQRRVDRQTATIGEAWREELPFLQPLPAEDFPCCVTRPVTLNGYSQVEYESNRYSVPVERAYPNLTLRAYPFRIDIVHMDEVIASHPRCYGHQQDVLNPLHYLPLLEQQPGAFEHAVPLRRWRRNWPPVYERLLAHLREKWPDGRGVREFVRILKLHGEHPPALIAQAVEQALAYGCGHLDGVRLCLCQLSEPAQAVSAIDLSAWPRLAAVGAQPLDLACYDQLLGGTR